jgi:hypothetical protein
MNAALEAIFDQLIGAGDDTFPAEMPLTAFVLRVLRDAGLTSRTDPSMALGHPKLFGAALDAASSVLPALEDRRQLALTVFTDVPLRAKPPIISAQQYLELALWGARRAHPLVCRADCPWVEVVVRYVERRLKNPQSRAIRRDILRAGEEQCPLLRDMLPDRRRILGSQALAGALRTAETIKHSWPGVEAIGGIAAASRLVALVEGIAGATEFCLTLARRLGMTL